MTVKVKLEYKRMSLLFSGPLHVATVVKSSWYFTTDMAHTSICVIQFTSIIVPIILIWSCAMSTAILV